MKSGDPCPACTLGNLFTYCTKRRAARVVRYLRCNCCRRTAGKVTAETGERTNLSTLVGKLIFNQN